MSESLVLRGQARTSVRRRSARRPQAPGPAERFATAVLASYSQVLFARSPLVGLTVLAATFVVPTVGVVGLTGVVLALGSAQLLGLDQDSIDSGVLGYNALLVFLLVGSLLEPGPAFWLMAAVLAALVVVVHVGMATALRYHLALPVLSLPFVLVGWVTLASVPFVRGMTLREAPAALSLEAFPGPEVFDTLLRSLGAIFFQPHWLAGLLVLTGLLCFSRIATLHALVGFAVALVADQLFFSFPPDFVHLYVGFNFVMTAIALGGIYYVPGPASMLLAAAGSLACGLLSAGLIRVLQPVGLPVLALPFNLIVLITLYALAQRSLKAQPRPVDFATGSPEDNLNYWRTRVRRFRHGLPVRLQLPFRGTWICTQGNDGAHTHQGPWRHGLDFEVQGPDGLRYTDRGDRLSDWHCYRLPVLAPGAGTVVRVVDGLPDSPLGEPDVRRNWGNVVVVQHAPAVYSLVAHLSPGTITVQEGEVVALGQVLGEVGSSGRCEVPHLHLQLQATPGVGDPTIPIQLHGIIRDEEATARLLSDHVPVEGEQLRNLVRDPALASSFAFPPGLRLLAEVESDEGHHQEELVAEIDALGSRSLHEPRTGARLWFDNRGESFVVYDHSGPRSGALFALYAALARVPLEQGACLEWSDHLNPRRLGSTPLTWLRDATAALLPPADQPISFVARQRAGRQVIEGLSSSRSGQLAVRSRAVIQPGGGIESVDVRIGSRRLYVSLQQQ